MGVEDEGGVGVFIAIGIVGFAAVAFKSFGQIAEGAFDVGGGAADVQALRCFDAVVGGSVDIHDAVSVRADEDFE